MTRVYITIDTELSLGTFQREGLRSLGRNHSLAIDGVTNSGSVGIGYQMDVLESYGLKGVFFVDPMPALVYGIEPIRRIVAPILARGHDLQLHIHTEWLEFARSSPVDGRTGRHMGDFSVADQIVLIRLARDLLTEAGAPPPIAFRAGNFGADDRTLDALREVGLSHDSSFSPGLTNPPCNLSLSRSLVDPVIHRGVIEVPVAAIETVGKRFRPAQLAALSWWEMRAALKSAVREEVETFPIVSHSFELLSRDRTRVIEPIRRRFDRLCAWLEKAPGITVTTFRDYPPQPAVRPEKLRLEPSALRTAIRIGEQWRLRLRPKQRREVGIAGRAPQR